MSMFSRSTIAVGAVLAALGALAAVALASGGEAAPTTAPAPSAETDPPVQVRTKVIRRTVHVRPQSSADDDGTLDQGPGDRPQIPVTSAPPATSAPAATATVSGHDIGDDHGRHHGDDDDFDDDHSGHGGGDDDSSGHGGGDDDDSSGHGGGDDDHSGHGGGGDDD
jgi:hypothetical protein